MFTGRYVVHPFLLALYPIIFLYAHNIDLYLGTTFLRPAIISLGLTTMLWLLLVLFTGSARRAGVILSTFILGFFTYGHINALLGDFSISFGDYFIGKSKLTLGALAVVTLGVAIFIAKSNKTWKPQTGLLNLVAIALFVFPVIKIVGHENPDPELWRTGTVPLFDDSLTAVRPDVPNIYYIILDGYTRQDILTDVFGYDNADFMDALASRGFYIAKNSYSNYSQTILSLGSALNMNYIKDDWINSTGEFARDRAPLMRAIRENAVVRQLGEHDYQFVALTSGYWGVDIPNADLNPRASPALSEFELILLDSTPVLDVLYTLGLFDPWSLHAKRIEFIWDQLGEATAPGGPKFVFAHVIAPHPPFVFDADGTWIDFRKTRRFRTFTYVDGIHSGNNTAVYKTKYLAQLKYVNGRVISAIDAILANSEKPPVIVIQGDHGSSSRFNPNLSNPDRAKIKERHAILNAYLLPAADNGMLYESLTPVNSFRVIFNQYFGYNLPLLPDQVLYSSWLDPFDFEDVTDSLDEEIQ